MQTNKEILIKVFDMMPMRFTSNHFGDIARANGCLTAKGGGFYEFLKHYAKTNGWRSKTWVKNSATPLATSRMIQRNDHVPVPAPAPAPQIPLVPEPLDTQGLTVDICAKFLIERGWKVLKPTFTEYHAKD